MKISQWIIIHIRDEVQCSALFETFNRFQYPVYEYEHLTMSNDNKYIALALAQNIRMSSIQTAEVL